MKNAFKQFRNYFGFVALLAAIVTLTYSCTTSKPSPDPLTGFQLDFDREQDETIAKDYNDYIQKLPLEEKQNAQVKASFKDETGQHAVEIEVALNGTWWEHILIYDKENKRIKVIKFSPGKYRS